MLAMSALHLVVFASLFLENHDLASTAVGHDVCFDGCALKERLTNLQAVAIAEREDLIEDNY